jgi:hypothetical protein
MFLEDQPKLMPGCSGHFFGGISQFVDHHHGQSLLGFSLRHRMQHGGCQFQDINLLHICFIMQGMVGHAVLQMKLTLFSDQSFRSLKQQQEARQQCLFRAVAILVHFELTHGCWANGSTSFLLDGKKVLKKSSPASAVNWATHKLVLPHSLLHPTVDKSSSKAYSLWMGLLLTVTNMAAILSFQIPFFMILTAP